MNHKNYSKQDIERTLHAIQFDHGKRADVFLALPPEIRAVVLLRLGKHVLHDLATRVGDAELITTLEQMDPDEATDVLQTVPGRRRKKIMSQLSERLRNDVYILSEFDPASAAGLMNLDYIQVDESDSIAAVAKQFRVHEKRTGRLPAVLAMRNGRLVGYVPGHELGFGKPADPVRPYIRRMTTIRHDATKEDVVHVFRSHPHNKVAVLGDRENVMGIIYSDDVLRLLEEEQSASLYDFAGVHDEESVGDSARTKIRFRYKWLMVNLGTAFLAATIVGLFEETIAKYVLLAVYMPIVAGMGGNAGTQTLAVLVRGIALKQIELRTAWPTLRRELGAGLVNGAINGTIVASVVMVLNREPVIALILGLAMTTNLLVAAFFGTVIPLLMKRLGKDPATSATVFITTATDVLGFLVFLGLAALVLT